MFLRTKGAVQARTNHSVVAPVVASVLALPMYHLITHHLLAVDFHQEGTKVTDMLLGQGQDMIGIVTVIVNPHPDLVTNLDFRRPGLATERERDPNRSSRFDRESSSRFSSGGERGDRRESSSRFGDRNSSRFDRDNRDRDNRDNRDRDNRETNKRWA